jgi:hypothetical protein
MEFYATVDKTSNTIISYYWSEQGIDLTKPGTDHIQDNLIHVVVPENFRGEQFLKINPDTLLFEIDRDAINQSVTDQWAYLREQRNKKLAACDWTVTVSDRPLSEDKKAEWIAYRQALRDLPVNTPDPANPTWPTPPN